MGLEDDGCSRLVLNPVDKYESLLLASYFSSQIPNTM